MPLVYAVACTYFIRGHSIPHVREAETLDHAIELCCGGHPVGVRVDGDLHSTLPRIRSPCATLLQH